MDAYEVHKKIQEAIMAVEIYKLKSLAQTSMWHKEIVLGLRELGQLGKTLDVPSEAAGHMKLSNV